MFTNLKFSVLILSLNAFLSVFSQNCDETSSSGYLCDKILLSYPVREGDTIVGLALEFNVTVESIVFANDRYSKEGFKRDDKLMPLSTLLIPLESRSSLTILAKPQVSIQAKETHKRRKKKMRKKIGIYVAIAIVGLLASIAIGLVAFFLINKNKKRQDSINNIDVEQQQLSLSVRTTSDKKVSFEGSQYNFDDPNADNTTATPRKTPLENYSLDELHKATEDFNVSNLIEGSVFHGRLKGKNLAIKKTSSHVISKIDFLLIHERTHRHPKLLRFLGTCTMEGSDSFIVHEYAKNGSLKDWIHSGLAIKSHFIASCSCFLTWNQRLKICLDIATALQYMHHIINPSYVHMNIKSRNIFLDEEFNAKLGNFGMANCVQNEHQWNKGYLAPEFITQGLISSSIDIFAYGVVLLEVLSGKPPIRRDDEGEEDDIIKLCDEIKNILELENAEELREWIDSALGDNYSFDGAIMLANLARACVENDPSLRPNAGEIVEKLLRLVQELPESSDQLNVSESSCKPLVMKKGEDFV